MSDSPSIEEIRHEVHAIRTEQIEQGRQLARHDEAIGSLRSGHDRLYGQIDAVRREVLTGVDGLRTELRDRFDALDRRLDSATYKAGEDDGAAQARQAQRSWVSIAVTTGGVLVAALVAMAGWWVAQ